MGYFLAIDMGTTSVKAVAFSGSAEMLYRYSVNNTTLQPQAGYAEQEPYTILLAVIECINAVTAYLQHPPMCISFSAALHGLIVMDADGNALTNCILWNDTRANAEAEELYQNKSAAEFYTITGVPVHAMTPACKILWLQKNEPKLFNKAAKFISLKEYVFFALTQQYVIDTSIATATGLCNIHKLQWETNLLNKLQISEQQLSTIVAPETVFHGTHTLLPDWISKVPLVIGGGDGPLANLGMGVSAPHQIAVTIGTSAAARRTIHQPILNASAQTFCYFLHQQSYVMGGASNNGASVIQWFKNEILKTNSSFENLFNETVNIEPGSDGLVVLPYIAGERAPLWNAEATAAFVGLTRQHTQAHCMKAVMEGVLLNVYAIIKQLITDDNTEYTLFAGGGFAESTIWVQMLADITNMKVILPNTIETSALGAAIIGAKAINAQLDVNSNNIITYEPNVTTHQLYQEVWMRYQRILGQLELIKKPL
ncbi:gluconokinase [Hydrotalea sandarakina]|jgi:gluconokinase|uniref:Gluconokinase n=1 Tax=Hydrotalea sandarakina TaxID=1004304 RepID=A0A2W7RR66_9BACT|nr:gluconokinase [Hydrotalea sandarakina]PZX62881.1 gluconokinase [Hydrotalea sandarakina]